MSRIATMIVALACLLAAAVPGHAGRAAKEAGLKSALEGLVARDGGPPGASVLLRRGPHETFLRAGVADVETGTAFRRAKRMRIASVSKAFSGAVGLSLVDEGTLSLDGTLAELLPGAPPAWGAVTLRQVMSHTGGLPSFTRDPEFLEYFSMNLRGQITMEELIAFVADEPLEFPPGSAYEYSNTDNIVIALIAEVATGMTYDELLAAHVFEPLDLRSTRLPEGFVLPGPRIEGYELFPTENVTECCSMAFVAASGGLFSTPHELTRFVRGYVGGELFGPATQARQLEFVPGASEPPGPGENSGGLALFRYRTRCGNVYGHTGNFPGYTQFTAATRSARRSLTVSANRQLDPAAPGERAPEAFEDLRGIYARAVCTLRSGPLSSR